jgi:hypothetical protein
MREKSRRAQKLLIWATAGVAAGLAVVMLWVPPAAAGNDIGPTELCYRCIQDAIYADTRLIAHLEANPDVDDAVRGPAIAAARADIHRLKALLGPSLDAGPEPCCYARPPLRIR